MTLISKESVIQNIEPNVYIGCLPIYIYALQYSQNICELWPLGWYMNNSVQHLINGLFQSPLKSVESVLLDQLLSFQIHTQKVLTFCSFQIKFIAGVSEKQNFIYIEVSQQSSCAILLSLSLSLHFSILSRLLYLLAIEHFESIKPPRMDSLWLFMTMTFIGTSLLKQ